MNSESLKEAFEQLKKIDEQAFKDKYKRKSHYIKHPIKGINSEIKYEKEADKLALTPIDNINIFGYISNKNNSICKWDKKNRLFVIYTMDKNNKYPIIKSFYRKSRSDYEKDKSNQAIQIL